MLSRQQELRAYCPNIYTVGTSCKRRREKKIKMFCIALMVTFDLFKLTYRMTWVKKRRQTTRQLWHFTDENQGAKKFEKRNLAHFHTWAWFHIFVYFSNKFLKKNDNINFKNIPRTIQDDLKIIIWAIKLQTRKVLFFDFHTIRTLVLFKLFSKLQLTFI